MDEIRKRWGGLCVSERKEIGTISNEESLLHNILCAKTPTPSTVLDIWETTQGFFADTVGNILKSIFPEYNRLRVGVNPLNNKDITNWGKGTLDAKVIKTRKQIEILFKNKNEIEIVGEIYSADSSEKEWKNERIRITDKDSEFYDEEYKITSCNKGTAFVPYRNITATPSPNLFMAIVPADRALEISSLIYQKYIEQFGKVMGRLPFSIGNIFFGDKMPMFVVLDAGKRMIANFDSLAKKSEKFILTKDKTLTSSNCNFHLKWETKNNLYKSLTWQLPHKLGNCADDYHHPYFIIDTEEDLSSERSTFFKTIAGNVVHFTEIEKGDVLSVYPNYYDFEFLDSNARRHDITLNSQGRRKSNVADFRSKPFLLDELSQKIMCLWDELLQGKQLKGITDTKLRNLQSLWLTKYQEWKVDIGKKKEDNYKIWMDLVLTSIQNEFKKLDDENCALLIETIENGLFFDTLELYLGIMKERIDKKEGGN